MKTLQKSILAVAILAVSAVSANAAVTYGAGTSGQPYAGVKVSQLTVDTIQKGNKATAYGVYAGYQFDPNFGAELEYQGATTKEHTINANRYKLAAKTYGAYGTYKYSFNDAPFYAKGKLGVARTQVSDTPVNTGLAFNRSPTGLAGGVGVGYSEGNFGVELSYDVPSSQTKAISLGAHLKF